MNHVRKIAVAGVLLTALLIGCSKTPKPQPLTASSFAGPRAGDAGAVRAAPGERTTPAVAIPLNGDNQPRTIPPNPAPPIQTTANPATRPANGLPPVGATSGQFMTLGGVVAEVNGTPIYANKVIAMLERDQVIQRMSQQLDPVTFKQRIVDDIRRQIHELVLSELLYAAAMRNLDTDDLRLVSAKTIYWRQQQITKAGGSVELARKKAHEEGFDFEEKIEDYRRFELTRTYLQLRIFPRIQVLAQDIRDYYEKNRDKEFSQAEKVKFRLLKVDVKKTGSKEAAIDKINLKRQRAKNGEDFAEMVLRENDEKMFAIKDPWETAPKSFSIVKVREALDKLQAGQISDVIEDSGAYYLVKLEERQAGMVKSFEDPKVQQAIREELHRRQQNKLRGEHQASLLAKAVVRPEREVILGIKKPANETEREMLNVALEMAMQRYARYVAAK